MIKLNQLQNFIIIIIYCFFQMTKLNLEKIIQGFVRALMSSIIGVISAYAIKAIVIELTDNIYLASLISILIFSGSVHISLQKMNYWGILYTIGWFIGLTIIYRSMESLISPIEFIINGLIVIFFVVKKFRNKLGVLF